MREQDVRTVLLVRAFEEADGDGLLLSAAERSRATEDARVAHAENPEALVLSRAKALFALLETRCKALDTVARGELSRRFVIALLLLPALLGLFFGDTLGLVRGTTLSVISAPLLTLLAWNAAVYLYLIWHFVGRRGRARAAGEKRRARELASASSDGAEREHGWFTRLLLRGVRRGMGRVSARRAEEQVVVGRALTRWATLSGRDSSKLIGARVRLLLHIAALELIVVAIAVMYARGLISEFHATWESTFLTTGGVQALVDIVLGPAAWLIGTTVPDVAGLEASVTQPATQSAALWVHLYALTAAWAVVVPRALLALWERFRVARLRAEHPFDLSESVYQRIVHGSRLQARRVELRPYSMQLDARRRDALAVMMHELFGVRADVQIAEAMTYGDEWVPPEGVSEGGCVVVLFPLGQPPESEVHGALLETAKARLGEGQRLLVLLEGSRYRERLGDLDDRLAERTRAWERVVREVELSAAQVDLNRPVDDAELASLEAAVWPRVPREAHGGKAARA